MPHHGRRATILSSCLKKPSVLSCPIFPLPAKRSIRTAKCGKIYVLMSRNCERVLHPLPLLPLRIRKARTPLPTTSTLRMTMESLRVLVVLDHRLRCQYYQTQQCVGSTSSHPLHPRKTPRLPPSLYRISLIARIRHHSLRRRKCSAAGEVSLLMTRVGMPGEVRFLSFMNTKGNNNKRLQVPHQKLPTSTRPALVLKQPVQRAWQASCPKMTITSRRSQPLASSVLRKKASLEAWEVRRAVWRRVLSGPLPLALDYPPLLHRLESLLAVVDRSPPLLLLRRSACHSARLR